MATLTRQDLIRFLAANPTAPEHLRALYPDIDVWWHFLSPTERQQFERAATAPQGPPGGAGGGDAGPTSPSGFADAPSFTANSPTSFAGMLASAVTGNPTPSNTVSGLTNLGLKAAGMLTGIPTMPVTLPVAIMGQLSKIAHRLGLEGEDTSGMMGLTQGEIDAALGIAPGSGPNVAANIAQGLGITPGQLAAMNLALSPRGIDVPSFTSEGVDPEGPSNPGVAPTAGLSNEGLGIGASDSAPGDGSASGPGGSAGAPSGGGDSGNPGDFNRGGTVRNRFGTLRGTRDTVPGRLTPGEEVIRKTEASKPGIRPVLKDINKPGVSPVERRVAAMAPSVKGPRPMSAREKRVMDFEARHGDALV